MGFFTAQEFNDLWDAMDALNDEFLFYKGKSVELNGEHITTASMPVPSVMNNYYERNIDKLATLTNPVLAPDTRTWKARDVYTRLDFDRLQSQLAAIKTNLEAEVNHTLYCGAFRAGSDRRVQTFGRGS